MNKPVLKGQVARPTKVCGITVDNRSATRTTMTTELQPERDGSPSLRWSADEPKAAGWWWAERISGDRQVVRVSEENGRLEGLLWVNLGDSNFWPVSSGMFSGWRWAGPLVEPLEAADEETRQSEKLTNRPSK